MFFAVASRLQELALSLSLKCLSFDFVGTSIDESSEEFGTVQVHSNIMSTSIVIFYFSYKLGGPSLSTFCISLKYLVHVNPTDSIFLEGGFRGFFNIADIF